MMRPLRLIALDLSLTGTGIASTHSSAGDARLWCTTIAPRRRPSETTIDHARLHDIISTVTGLATSWKPDLVVIEKPLQRPGQGDTSIRLAELHGPIKHWLWCRGIRYVDVNLTHVKQYATGNGSADKDLVLASMIATYGRLLHIGDHNQADAVSLLAMALDQYGQPLVEVPETHRRALRLTRWPQLDVSTAVG
jgi:crossover junction endodeoxyribonuclease RuvC